MVGSVPRKGRVKTLRLGSSLESEPKKGSVICVEKHFFRTTRVATSAFLTASGAENLKVKSRFLFFLTSLPKEEDVTMTVRSSYMMVVWTPFGVVDCSVALHRSCASVHCVVMLEHCCVCCNVPDDEEAVVGTRHEQVGQGGVRFEDVHLVLVTHQPLQQGLHNDHEHSAQKNVG